MDRQVAASWVAVGIGAAVLSGFALLNHTGARVRTTPPPAGKASTTTRLPTGDPHVASALSIDGGFSVDADATRHQATYRATLTNIAEGRVLVTGVDARVPGLKLVDAHVSPGTLPHLGRALIFLTVIAPDCRKVDKGDRPVPVTYTAEGRTYTQDLELTGASPDQSWQVAALDALCS